MALILRKRSTGETLRLRGAKVLSHHSRKLAFLAPYVGQWVFYSLVPSGSGKVLYNHQPAPPRCAVAVGDLLNLKGSEFLVEAVEIDLVADRLSETDTPPICEIEVAGGSSVRITHDLLIGSDPCRGRRSANTLDLPPLSALIAFAAGRWHLHDLNGAPLFRNGKPAGRSLVLADGDYVRLGDKYLRFRIGAVESGAEEIGERNEEKQAVLAPCSLPVPTARDIPAAPEVDLAYQKAKNLVEELLPVLRQPGCCFQPQRATDVGVRGWLRIFRRPGGSIETLERLEFLLSASPRDRVWLFELARFLYQQSYPALCLRLLKELCRLHPRDARVRQTLAKFYYQQGRNPLLPAEGRLNAFEHGRHCVRTALRLEPNDTQLLDLEQAIRMEQTILTYSKVNCDGKGAGTDYRSLTLAAQCNPEGMA